MPRKRVPIKVLKRYHPPHLFKVEKVEPEPVKKIIERPVCKALAKKGQYIETFLGLPKPQLAWSLVDEF